ncbi:hypothetical protein D3C76_1674210 [compost metagenome]
MLVHLTSIRIYNIVFTFPYVFQFIGNGIFVKHLDVFLAPLFLLTMIGFRFDVNLTAPDSYLFAEFILRNYFGIREIKILGVILF